MGTREEATPPKTTRPASSSQEIPTTPSYPDWSSSMQAYYGAGATPPPFFASTPSPHHYMWGGQHPLIPPYGTPVPYPAIYPPGGVFAHPNMTTVPLSAQTNTETEGKVPDGKDKASGKKTKGGQGNSVKAAPSGSGNDGQSTESATEGSSDGSDENPNQQEFSASKKGSFNQMLADGANAQNSSAGPNLQSSVTGKPIVPMPPTNLNIGMDLWNLGAAGSGPAKVRPNQMGGALVPAPPEQWIQKDERELKRQKRKQSNRESARRSRLRKQAECEELQARVEALSNENITLRDELQGLSDECEKLVSENSSLKEELTQLCGPEVVSNLEDGNPKSALQSQGGEGKS